MGGLGLGGQTSTTRSQIQHRLLNVLLTWRDPVQIAGILEEAFMRVLVLLPVTIFSGYLMLSKH